MNFYQELSILSNVDIGPYFIWQKVYQQIHLALVENKAKENASAVGSSFPEYNAAKYFLGTKLRLFAKEEKQLQQLCCDKRLGRLRDYVRVQSITPVPEKLTGYACFKHIKPKGNKEKLARRRAKRKGQTFQEALAHFENYSEPQCRLPYINMVSRTNGHQFRLFIKKQEQTQPQTGWYSCYGLSRTTTVPLF
jgi:CRISPR-associated endonuclease Csy4